MSAAGVALDLTSEEARRFWARVDKSGDCWVWTGTIRLDGYGVFKYRGLVRSAHRVAWEIEHGVGLTSDMHVLHACDNPPCVRHLFLGDHATNMADMARKGRARNGSQRLTEAQVREVRAMVRAGHMQKDVAAQFGVDPSLISHIMCGRVWRRLRDAA